MNCEQCQGTRWYTPPSQRGTVHSYRCDACCEHKGGRWLLKENYGEDNGKWCCIDGCGKVWDTEDGE
jgi:hypothetical protein